MIRVSASGVTVGFVVNRAFGSIDCLEFTGVQPGIWHIQELGCKFGLELKGGENSGSWAPSQFGASPRRAEVAKAHANIASQFSISALEEINLEGLGINPKA